MRVKTLTLQDRCADADDISRVYSMDRGDKISRMRNFEFRPLPRAGPSRT